MSEPVWHMLSTDTSSTRTSSAPSALAAALISSSAGPLLEVMIGTPLLMMPAFSAAISAMVLPRNCVCSLLMLVMTVMMVMGW